MTSIKPSLLATLAATLLVAGCQKAPETTGVPAGARPAPEQRGEGRLVVLAWPGYFQRGQGARDWVSAFEKKTGCMVTVNTAASSDDMVAMANGGGMDVITASGDASLRLVAAGKVRPLQISRIPSYGAIDARLRDASWHTVDGVHYGVPFQWGPNVLLYDSSVFKEAPGDWGVVFEEQALPDGKSNRGRVQAFDGAMAIADAAVHLMQARPGLRISDPYQLNEAQYLAALAALRKQKSLVHRYWRDPSVQVDDFRNEGVVASVSWPAQSRRLVGEGVSAAWIVPGGGATGWADSLMLATAAKHPNCAYQWMEWALGTAVQGDIAATFGSVPAVPRACRDNPMLGPDGCVQNGADSFERIYFWRTPGLECGTQACVPYSRWTGDFLKLVEG